MEIADEADFSKSSAEPESVGLKSSWQEDKPTRQVAIVNMYFFFIYIKN